MSSNYECMIVAIAVIYRNLTYYRLLCIIFCFFIFILLFCVFLLFFFFFFFQAEDGIRDGRVTGVQTCALPIYSLLTMIGSQGVERSGAVSSRSHVPPGFLCLLRSPAAPAKCAAHVILWR